MPQFFPASTGTCHRVRSARSTALVDHIPVISPIASAATEVLWPTRLDFLRLFRLQHQLMKKYIAEFIGTFFLVLTIGCTVIGGGLGVIPPLAIGAALMVMIYAGGHISGAHYNPAVTLGVLIRGKLNVGDAVPYILAQLGGAAVATVAVKFLRAGVDVTPGALQVGPALLAEFLFTFALVYVVLNAATAEGTSGNSFYGLAIGMTVMTGAFAVGDISGGAFNPAVALGISLLGLSSWSNIWIYLVANFSAAIVAAIVFNLINPPAQTTPIATDEPPYETPR
jgi:aquaporin Z